MKLSIISDEISKDPHAAVFIGSQHLDIHLYELRFMADSRVPDVPDKTIEELAYLKSKYDVTYSAIAAGLFKCLPLHNELETQLKRLDKAIAMAKKLDVKTITGFCGHDVQTHRSGELREIVVPYLKHAVERAANEGIVFAVETEYMTGCENAKDAKLLLDLVGPQLKVNWDPANSWVAGEDPLEGYQHIKGNIVNIHCKDAYTHDWRSGNPFVAFGDGLVPWEKLLPVLVKDDSVTTLTVETHIEPVIPKSVKSVKRLRHLLNVLKFPSS